MTLPKKIRFSIAGMLAAILLLGLPLAWVRVELNHRAAFEATLRAKLEKPNASVFTGYSYRLPRHRLFGYFESGQNVNQLCEIGLGGEITDDDVRVLDEFPNLEIVRLYETNVTDAGLLHLARQHPYLTTVEVTGGKITRDGVKKIQMERPGVAINYHP
jgi:hypothetical protein